MNSTLKTIDRSNQSRFHLAVSATVLLLLAVIAFWVGLSTKGTALAQDASRDARERMMGDSVSVESVGETFITHPLRLYLLTVELEDFKETLRITGEHPVFIVEANDFMPISQVVVGQSIATASGEQARIARLEAIETHGKEAFQTYNFEVPGSRTYFVGKSKLWVHNTGVTTCKYMAARFFRLVDQGESVEDALRSIEPLIDKMVIIKNKNTPGINFTKEKWINYHAHDILLEIERLDPIAAKKLYGGKSLEEFWTPIPNFKLSQLPDEIADQITGPMQKAAANTGNHYAKHAVGNGSQVPGGEFPAVTTFADYIRRVVLIRDYAYDSTKMYRWFDQKGDILTLFYKTTSEGIRPGEFLVKTPGDKVRTLFMSNRIIRKTPSQPHLQSLITTPIGQQGTLLEWAISNGYDPTVPWTGL